jgi:hypothetical protein
VPYLPKSIPSHIDSCPFVSIAAYSNYIGLCVEEYPIISIISVR